MCYGVSRSRQHPVEQLERGNNYTLPCKREWHKTCQTIGVPDFEVRKAYPAGTSRRVASLRSIVLIKVSTSAGFTK
jgi:hypothetical protein